MEIQQMSQAGLKFLIDNEGLRLKPYLDTKGIATIGVGATYYENGVRVKMTDPAITVDRAIVLFKNLLKHYEMEVCGHTRDDITQNQFDALVSLAYNIGTPAFKGSTLVKRINARMSDAEVRVAFLMWNKPPEIMRRRMREVTLYFKK